MFSVAGTGRLVRIEGKMNRAKYREIKTGSRELRTSEPKHIFKTIQEGLRDKSLNVLEWASQSLDLNPIKNSCAETFPIQPDIP